ncbi:nuclease HARBI1 [Trichonephila clavipes]|nr:nuclease HARBI1 [Trichonephila clavipes]
MSKQLWIPGSCDQKFCLLQDGQEVLMTALFSQQQCSLSLVFKTNALYQDFHLLEIQAMHVKNIINPLGIQDLYLKLGIKRYNKSHVLTRNTIERKYGILKRRFPCLSIGLNCHIDRVPAIVVACCVLHNLCIRLDQVLSACLRTTTEGNTLTACGENLDKSQNARRRNYQCSKPHWPELE